MLQKTCRVYYRNLNCGNIPSSLIDSMTISHFLFLLFIAIIVYSLFPSSNAQPPLFYFSSANISTTWINNQSTRYILLIDASNPLFGCGFICPGPVCLYSFLFSIFVGGFNDDPHIVWSANRDRPVQENATLEFSLNGDLVLRDFDGTTVWSTNTSGKSVVGMKLNELGNLVLFDDKNTTVWSSMDYPTDSLVLGQTLRQNQRLTANVSVTNSSQGPLYLTVVRNGIEAFVGSQIYYGQYTVSFKKGSLDLIDGSVGWSVPLPVATLVQYMQLDYEGHLRLYGLKDFGWVLLGDVFKISNGDCGYPNVCGKYGICSNGQCSCPDSTYLTPINVRNPIAGCTPFAAISCESYKAHQFLSLPNVSYFGLDHGLSNQHPFIDYLMPNSTEETCKQACLSNCSCKAAFFQYDTNASNGYCYFPQEWYSLNINIPMNRGYNSSAFIKVQSFPVKKVSTGVIIAACVGSVLSFFLVALCVIALVRKVGTGVIIDACVGSVLSFFLVALCVIDLVRRRYNHREDEDDDEFNRIPGLPTRFALEDLRVATNGFLRKLGEGGFGSVFEGTLVDGTKIAVKRLDGVGQGKKEFLAEVETIGRIHHLHLVRLVGFCAEKSYRLLIYEYMLNGSLDKWIFYKDHDTVLDWQTRRKIITDVAKGLTYLHEECRQKIVHLDIKPQNILLDENFNAKVSDFGLAKLMDRDQIEVMTRMRGTPGYLAPEWLTSVITEKVDVFSFDVVVLETVCGRRNIDNSKDEENFHLISVLQRKVAENKLVDMVDRRCIDMQIHIEDVIMIMHLAMWCLQSDINHRPVMSEVINVLKGSMNVETNLDYNFAYPTPYVSRNANIVESIQITPSMLSGPR